MPSTVLIIVNAHDIHADAVVLELNKRDVPVVANMADLLTTQYSKDRVLA